MRTSYTILVILVVAIVQRPAMMAQLPGNIAAHQHDGAYGDLVASGQRYFFVSDLNPSLKCGNVVTLKAIDLNGQLQWTLPIQKPSGMVNVTQLVRLSTGDLLLAGHYHGVDYQAPKEKLFVMKVTTNGTVVFDNDFSDLLSRWAPVKIVESPDGNFFAVHDGRLFHLNSSGNLVSKKDLSFSDAAAITMTGDDRVVVNALYNNVNTHLLIDTGGTVVSNVPGSQMVHQYLRNSAGSIVGITANALVKLTPGLTISGAFSIPSGGAGKMAERNDSIFLVTGFHRYLVLDSAFNVLHTYSLQVGDRSTDGIALIGGQVTFVSNATGRKNIMNGIEQLVGRDQAITSFPVGQGFSYPKDIGVVGATCNSCLGSYYVPMNTNIAVTHFTLVMDVVVRNHGTQPISSFALTSDRFPPFTCGVPYYHEEFNVSPVPPGGTVQVTTAPFRLYQELTPPASTYLFTDIGFFTSVPNHEVDGNSANDFKAVDAQMVILGLEEQHLSSTAVKLFPQPSDGKVGYECRFDPEVIRILTLDGREAARILETKSRGEIDITSLPPGMYLIRFENSANTVVGRIVRL